jgi:beta-glucosidase
VWSTHNEPWNNSFSGYGSGAFAPGGPSHAGALAAAHHLNLSHGLAVQALRSTITRPDAQISVALNNFRIEPAGPDDADAARRFDAIANRIFTGPMLRGEYPDDLILDTAKFTDWDFVKPGDLEIAHQPIDLLGLNYYEVMHVRANPAFDPASESDGGTDFPGSERIEFVRRDDLARTGMDWGIEPRGLEEHLVALSEEFPSLPIMVMENGAAFRDTVVDVDGIPAVFDVNRVNYLSAHVAATVRAVERGANVIGYLVWSLLDNFEWTAGYGPRFGLIHIDYETLERTPKLSSRWFAELCATRALPVRTPSSEKAHAEREGLDAAATL